MVKSLADYRKEIKKATTHEELMAISLNALKNDDACTVFSKKYDKIVSMCTQRENELGIGGS